MPARRDIDPTEFVPHLPGIMLVDVVADERRYVYRLVGTREVEARGQNPTGRPVGESFHGSSRENVLRNYERVCREARPCSTTTISPRRAAGCSTSKSSSCRFRPMAKA
jgi:hypothetical protein